MDIINKSLWFTTAKYFYNSGGHFHP